MAVMARGAAIDFLLASEEPAIRYLTRHDVLGEDVTPDRDETLSGPLVRGLLRGQKRDGGFGGTRTRSGTVRTGGRLGMSDIRGCSSWPAKGSSWWRKLDSLRSNVEVVDWGGRGPSEMTTLNALRILKAAGRLDV
jgi:hypothetical protein